MQKKYLIVIAKRVYAFPAPAKSGAGRENPDMTKATPDANSVFFCVATPTHPFAVSIRNVSMVALAGQLSGWPVPFVAGILTPVNVTTLLERENSGGDSLYMTKEIGPMLTIQSKEDTFFNAMRVSALLTAALELDVKDSRQRDLIMDLVDISSHLAQQVVDFMGQETPPA